MNSSILLAVVSANETESQHQTLMLQQDKSIGYYNVVDVMLLTMSCMYSLPVSSLLSCFSDKKEGREDRKALHA